MMMMMMLMMNVDVDGETTNCFFTVILQLQFFARNRDMKFLTEHVRAHMHTRM